MSKTMTDYRTMFERTFAKTLTEVEREWSESKEVNGAEPVRFEMSIRVRLANGHDILCCPVGKLTADTEEESELRAMTLP